MSHVGKAALVPLAYDQRFAVVPIGSCGEGGAKLHRRNFGPAVENLTASVITGWPGNFLKTARRNPLRRKTAAGIPVDAHQLLALSHRRLTFVSYGVPGVATPGGWISRETT